jgi:hypothetical protein
MTIVNTKKYSELAAKIKAGLAEGKPMLQIALENLPANVSADDYLQVQLHDQELILQQEKQTKEIIATTLTVIK